MGVAAHPLYLYFTPEADLGALTSLLWLVFFPLFLAGVVATAVVLGEVRLRTGSIWPCVVMHTVGGAVVNALILGGYLRFAGHGDALLSPAPNPIASVALLGLLGTLLLLRHAKAGARNSTVPDSAAVRRGSDRARGEPGSRQASTRHRPTTTMASTTMASVASHAAAAVPSSPRMLLLYGDRKGPTTDWCLKPSAHPRCRIASLRYDRPFSSSRCRDAFGGDHMLNLNESGW